MKLNRYTKAALLAGVGLAFAASTTGGLAQNYIVDTFDNSAQAALFSYDYGPAAGTASFSTDDANGSASSGSLELTITYTTNQFQHATSYNLPTPVDLSAATALEFDVKVDPASGLDQFGNATYFQLDAFVTANYNFVGLYGANLAPVSTNNGWQHIVVPLPTGFANAIDTRKITIDPYDGNYTNTQTAIFYVDNIKFDIPAPTFPNYTAFTFDNANFLGGVFTNWYGHPTTVVFSTNDAHGVSTSGSAEIVADIEQGDNNDIIAMFFDTNNTGFSVNPETNTIDGTHYQSVDFDIMWDTNLSTIDLTLFNQLGDISGMPLGLTEGPTTGNNGEEILGGGTTNLYIPNAASNGWVHMSLPINRSASGVGDIIGLYFKKYGNMPVSGTAAYFIDNVTFIGATKSVPRPTMSISKPTQGLTIINASGSPYDRESLETAAINAFSTNYSWVDQSAPVTYTIGIASFPTTSYPNYAARIYLAPNNLATEAEPDYVEPAVLMIDINRNSDNSATTTLRCKTNNANGNGNLYDAGLPSFSASGVIGNWSYTFTGNNSIHVVAPDGTSTNLAFPLGLSSTDVESYFGAGMVVYFGGYNNGGGNVGQRVVLSKAEIQNGSTVLLNDDFTSDTNLDINNGGGSTGAWTYASDSSVPTNAIFLTPTTTKYFVDWSVPASGFVLGTRTSLTSGAANTNTGVTAVQLGDHFHAELSSSNLPPSGNLFFELVHPGLTP